MRDVIYQRQTSTATIARHARNLVTVKSHNRLATAD